MNTAPDLAFNILVKFEDSEWIAHCLELDIVASAMNPEAAVDDLRDLILAQVSTAIANNNLDFLYHPAPLEVWHEYARAESLTNRNKDLTPERTTTFFQTIFASAFNTACHAWKAVANSRTAGGSETIRCSATPQCPWQRLGDNPRQANW